jgi:AcrR family transcriptional regulator
MPPKPTFTREDIVEAAFEIIRKQGRSKLSARAIAKELKCSTMPIYSYVSSLQDLKPELAQKFTDLFLQYTTTAYTGNFLIDNSFGYIRFAREEKELFRIMMVSDEGADVADFYEYKPIVGTVMFQRCKAQPELHGLHDEQIQRIMEKMWLIIYGLASLINCGRLDDDRDEYILALLQETSALFIQAERAKNAG